MSDTDEKKLGVGDIVTYRHHGRGRIISEWGGWFSCNGCHNETTPDTVCPRCKADLGCIHINGAGIFRIRFRDGIWEVHEHLLHKP